MAVMILGSMSACSFRDSLDECGLYLHFTYDYNMAYADAAAREIDRIDVLVFDADGVYLFTKTAAQDELSGADYTLSFFEELSFGTYTFLTWGGLSDDFSLQDVRTQTPELVSGQTRMEDIRLKMTRDQNADREAKLHPVWYGAPRSITYDPRAGRRTYRIDLVKDTNHFNIALTEENSSGSGVGELLLYTFEVISNGYDLYDMDNMPVGRDEFSYLPYSISSTEDYTETWGKLSTGRMLEDDTQTLVVRSAHDNSILWKIDLIRLLSRTKPDDIETVQEYLDRQDDWSLVFNYKGGTGDWGFIAVSVVINGWTIWLQDIDM